MASLKLKAGKVYRTRDLSCYDSNPTRLAGKLVAADRLRGLKKGLYYAPRQSAFGEVPPSEDALLKGYFGRSRYLRTGPSVWNALGLGSTAVEAIPLVYNNQCTGRIELGPRKFEFRRVKFPAKPPTEYFVVDLLENPARAGLDLSVARRALVEALREQRFDPERLLAMARKYGRRATQELVGKAVEDATRS